MGLSCYSHRLTLPPFFYTMVSVRWKENPRCGERYAMFLCLQSTWRDRVCVPRNYHYDRECEKCHELIHGKDP